MPSHRPKKLIGILGTRTEVGKTWVSTRLIVALRERGLRVAARKPVQSYEPHSETTDAALLARATNEETVDVCPSHRHYPLAMAPPMAAHLLNRPRIVLDELIDEIRWQEHLDIGLIETVGGPRSPLSHDGDSIDLLDRLVVDDVVLVADAELGTINAIRLCLQCFNPNAAVVVILNRYDHTNELHRLNRQWLNERYGVRTVIDIEELIKILFGNKVNVIDNVLEPF